MHIKAMSFNLRYDNPGDGLNAWGYRKNRVQAAVRKHDPLLIGTQEGLALMLQDLDELLPDYARVGEGRRGEREDEHTVIYFKKVELTLEDWGQFWLSEEPAKVGSIGWDSNLPRICTWASFRLVNKENTGTPGQKLRMYNTHLDHMGERARQEGAGLIWKMMLKHASHDSGEQVPVLLTGDFNSYPDSVAIRFLRGQLELCGERSQLIDAYSLIADEVGRTAHEFKGGETGQPPIDYLFGGFGFIPVEVSIDRGEFEGGYPSDHYPGVAVFEKR